MTQPKQNPVHLDVAATAVAVTRSSRVARAARAVTMAGRVGCALNDDAVAGAVVAVITVDQERKQEGDEEEDDVPVSLLVEFMS
jgi:hypothetical protein